MRGYAYIRRTRLQLYGVVNLDKVYEVVVVHLPGLIESILPVIRHLEREAGWKDD